MTESVKLPSEGKVYPIGHPLHNAKEVEIYYISGDDEELLTNQTYLKNGEMTNKLLEKILVNKDIDVDSLLVGDKYAILIYARLYSMGTDYEAKAQCEYCGEVDKYTFDISSVPIIHLGESANQLKEFENLFEYKTKRGNVIQFKLATVGMSKDIQKDIEGMEKFNKKHGNYSKDSKTIKTTYNHLIVSINGNTDRKEIDSFMKDVIMESREFRKHLKDITPTVEFKSSFYCVNCGKENADVELSFQENFFWSDF